MPAKKTNVPEPDDVRLLFGQGAFVAIHLYGRHDEPEKTIDITAYAEGLANAGIHLPRRPARPADVTGYIEGDLGSNGRATWTAGGGDLPLDDVLTAITAALEQLPPPRIQQIFDDRSRITRNKEIAAIEKLLARLGLTPAQITRLLRKVRPELDGRSIRDTLSDLSATKEQLADCLQLLITTATQTATRRHPTRNSSVTAEPNSTEPS